MKKTFKGIYLLLIMLFLYLPIFTLMVLSFNGGTLEYGDYSFLGGYYCNRSRSDGLHRYQFHERKTPLSAYGNK